MLYAILLLIVAILLFGSARVTGAIGIIAGSIAGVLGAAAAITALQLWLGVSAVAAIGIVVGACALIIAMIVGAAAFLLWLRGETLWGP